MHAVLLAIAVGIQLQGRLAAGFPWLSNGAPSVDSSGLLSASDISPSELLQSGTRRSDVYRLALHELQELEAEPLCHRVAARLLVNNCQLLDGKDEATVLTGGSGGRDDGGRRARDFVDSYAASLAICDLERASFHIPADCEPFREPALSRIPLSDTAQLHVPAAQIRACLAGLGDSPAAWNTWVSYSHKAMRFCEAARADHEKTQNILVFQRLTRIMAKLADDVEAELQRQQTAWDAAAQHADARLSRMQPVVDHLWRRLAEMEARLEDDIRVSLSRASQAAAAGAQGAETLQQLLAVMTTTVLEGQASLAFAHDQALGHVRQQASGELDLLASTMQAVWTASQSLQRDIVGAHDVGALNFLLVELTGKERSHLQAADLAARQGSLEEGMQRLAGLTQTLHADFGDHARLLARANESTAAVLDTLEATAAATSALQTSFLGLGWAAGGGGGGGWWPHVVCPAVSLVLGSYGLPPSVLRNMGLLALGELAGLAVSSFGRFRQAASILFAVTGAMHNATATMSG